MKVCGCFYCVCVLYESVMNISMTRFPYDIDPVGVFSYKYFPTPIIFVNKMFLVCR